MKENIESKKSNEKETLRVVMRYSGPRMIFVYPLMALKHVRTTLKQKRYGKVGV